MSRKTVHRTVCTFCAASCRVEPTYLQVLERWRNWPRFQLYKLHICPPCSVLFTQVLERSERIGEPVSVD